MIKLTLEVIVDVEKVSDAKKNVMRALESVTESIEVIDSEEIEIEEDEEEEEEYIEEDEEEEEKK